MKKPHLMKKLFPLFVAILLCFAATSCATLSSLNAIDTGTAVSSGNFHYVKSVEGVASGTYFLSLGGANIAKNALANAKAQASLKDNQALVNVAITNTTKYILFGLVIVGTTTVSADVIEFE